MYTYGYISILRIFERYIYKMRLMYFIFFLAYNFIVQFTYQWRTKHDDKINENAFSDKQ